VTDTPAEPGRGWRVGGGGRGGGHPRPRLARHGARFRADEPRDPRYDSLRRDLDAVEHIHVPTLMIQGGADRCDEPAASEGLGGYFDSSGGSSSPASGTSRRGRLPTGSARWSASTWRPRVRVPPRRQSVSDTPAEPGRWW